ncbi:MAG: phosphotransferase family protein, partial [Ktedonobacterales bacterium]
MDSLEAYIGCIREVVPSLAIESARLHTTDGQFTDIVFVNDALVFRFPRFASVAATLASETAALRALQGRLSLPIPDPLYAVIDDVPGRAFMSYRLLTGSPLSREAFDAIPDGPARNFLAAQLGGFLRGLHALEPGSLAMSLP